VVFLTAVFGLVFFITNVVLWVGLTDGKNYF